MTANPALKVFEGGEDREPDKITQPHEHSLKQSGVRMALFAVQVARDTGFSSEEIINRNVTSSLVSRYPSFTSLSVPKQRILLPFIEQFLSNGIIPQEDIIVSFLENMCDAASKLELPPEPHKGDKNQIILSPENEQKYTSYLNALGHTQRILERIFETYMATHQATLRNLSNSK